MHAVYLRNIISNGSVYAVTIPGKLDSKKYIVCLMINGIPLYIGERKLTRIGNTKGFTLPTALNPVWRILKKQQKKLTIEVYEKNDIEFAKRILDIIATLEGLHTSKH